MTFVLDASVALSHSLGEPEFREQAQRIIDSLESRPATVPAIWGLELASGLLRNERAKRLTKKDVEELVERWQKLPIKVDSLGLEGVLGAVVSLARKHNIAVYDAAYLELAVRQKVALATFDTALCEAARREGLDLLSR